jgi:O-antigen/teichoic acid export membrane protein
MYQAFLEASLRMKAAAVSFLLAKITFMGTALAMLVSDTATIISMAMYAFLVFMAIALSLLEGFSRKKKTYKELECEVAELKKMLNLQQSTAT